MPPKQPLWIRFWAKVDTDTRSGCWIWTGSIKPNGYGQVADDFDGEVRKTLYVHRVSYEWANGEIPDGTNIHHTCGNTTCVNPDHLTAVTHKAHMTRHASERVNIEDLTRLI
jgi:hypothetical protein